MDDDAPESIDAEPRPKPPRIIRGQSLAILAPSVVGICLMVGPIVENSATYDEVAYVRIACDWWTTGDQTEITRMGSPVSFWKWQGLPALAALETAGHSDWIADPHDRLPELLPWFRFSALWLWFLGLWFTQVWAVRAYGLPAGAFAGACYVLGPNLRAHGALMTMETPLWTFFAMSLAATCEFVRTWKKSRLIVAGGLAGLAFSMKFTAVLLPLLGAAVIFLGRWIATKRANGHLGLTGAIGIGTKTACDSIRFGASMAVANLVLTGFATLPLSERTGEHPWLAQNFPPKIAQRLSTILETPAPVDWVGFLTQLKHQRSGGPSYLLGEVSMRGWPWYYPVTLLTKCPLAILAALAIRPFLPKKGGRPEEWAVPLVCLAFLAIACAGSKRNYGYRYLLPLAPLAIVWLSAITLSKPGRRVAWAVVAALAFASFQSHSREMTWFNALAGGPERGRWILADSNLDWGQGLLRFRRLLKERPELADSTLFYFGDIDPAVYGIDVQAYLIDASDRFDHLPPGPMFVTTRFVAVSTSLVHGPWGPPGYFAALARSPAVATTSDGTIRFYDLGSR